MKDIVRLNESELNTLVSNIVKRVLREGYSGLIDNNGEDELRKAALENGFNYIAYHNTDNEDLTFFDVRTSGIHFGSRKAADDRGLIRDKDSYTNEYFLKIVKPYVIEKDFDWEGESLYGWEFQDEDEFNNWRKEYDPTYYLSTQGFKEFIYNDDGSVSHARYVEEMLADEGYDCIIYKNSKEDEGNYSVCMFNPNNIKLATITYDDNGNEIPLEKRFDTSTDDVRY